MATDEAKRANTARLVGISLRAMSMGIWDMVGDGANALCPAMGDQMLQLMEHEMGLEIAGENPEDVLSELARLFVDEFGIAQAVDVQHADDTTTMVVKGCAGVALTGPLVEAGADPFTCPFRNCGLAALTRAGLKTRPHITFDQPAGCTIAFRKR